MAYRGSGTFDVSSFLSPFRGDPLGGAKMSADAFRGVAQDAQNNMALLAQTRRARAAQDLERQAIGQRAQTAYMQQQQQNARKKAELDQAMELARQKRAQEQEQAGAGLMGEAAQAQARGDLNALAGIQARAQMLDPMMRMTLPGAAPQPRGDDGLPSVDEAYPLEQDALTIERGGKQLYGSGNADVRQREQDVIGRMISPLRSSPFAKDYQPSFEAGMGVAGAGMTGSEAAAAALKQGNIESDRLARMKNAETMAGAQAHRSEQGDSRIDIAVHQQIEAMGEKVKKDFGVVDGEKQLAGLAELNDMITQGVPFQQNEGLLLILKNTIRGAGSDKDMNQFEGAAGFWEKMARDFNKVAAGGAMPEGFKAQIGTALMAQQRALETKRQRAGLAIKDHVYNSSMLPIDDQRRVLEAHRKYMDLTGRQLPPEELKREYERYMKRKAAGLQPGGAPPMGTSRSFSESSSESGSLGVTGGRPPPIPLGPRGDVNDEVDDLLGEDD